MPQPRWGQVRRFCTVQGYAETVSDHWYYDKMLPGSLRSHTKVSFGRDGEQIPGRMWKLIWFHQLRLKTEDDFWRGLDGGAVIYNVPPSPEPETPLPEYLIRHLRDVRHYADARISNITREEAQRLLNEYYAHELAEPEET